MKKYGSKITDKRNGIAGPVYKAGLASLILLICLTFLETILADRMVLEMGLAPTAANAVWILSGVISGFIAAGKNGSAGILSSLLGRTFHNSMSVADIFHHLYCQSEQR